jgi:hypothetical protein
VLRLGNAVEDGADMATESFMMSFGDTVPVWDGACAVPEPLMAVQDDTKSVLESSRYIVLDESSVSPAEGKVMSSNRFISGECSFSDGSEAESIGYNSPGGMLEVDCILFCEPV